MPDLIIKTGDMVKVTISPPAIVPMLEEPAELTGSSENLTVAGTPACLLGDELPAELKALLPYTAPPFTNPGTGKLTLTLLPTNQTVITKNGKAILVKGQQFTALFTVEVPATQTTPAGPVPDPVATKPGTAAFITTNETVKAG
jgi:Contractile injection system spike tip protein